MVNSVSGPLEKAIYASCPASSQMRATWRTLTKRPISLSAAADDRLDPPIVSTTNPSPGRMRRGLRVEFSIKNHRKIAFSALFQCCIRLQLRRDHHQGSPDRRKAEKNRCISMHRGWVLFFTNSQAYPCQTSTLTLVSL